MAPIHNSVPRGNTAQLSANAAFENRERRFQTQRVSPARNPLQPKGTYACKFLQQLAPTGPWVLTAIHPDDRKQITTSTFTSIEDARKFIAQHNSAGRGIYYSINPCKTALQLKAAKSDIARIRYLHVDADPADNEKPEDFKRRLLETVAALPQQPTFIVDSGNGLQLLFRLHEAVEITSDEVIADIEARNYALALALDASPSTRNIDRIFRLPKTTNYPNAKKRRIGRQVCETKLIRYADIEHSLETFPPHQVQAVQTQATNNGAGATELPARLRTLLMTDGAGGYETRSHLLFAFLTSAIRAGLTDAVIIEACLDPRYAGKGIYDHVVEQGGRSCAERQLQRAHEKVGHGRQQGAMPESIHSWDEPDLSILDDRRGALPDFPLDVLEPQWLRDWVEQQAHGTGTTIDHVAVPFLGICSGIIGNARRAQAVKTWHQPATEWTCTVGYSGSGKTPGLDATRLPLDELEFQRSEHNATRKRAHDERTAQADIARSDWQKRAKAALKNDEEPPPMPNAAIKPDEYIEPRLFTTDATIEKLAVLLQARPQGMLLVMDELAGLFHNMSRYSKGQDNQFWLTAWDGKPRPVDRMGRPSIRVRNLLIGMVGGLQPDKLAEVFRGAADGMYARFLFSWPPTPAFRELDDTIEGSSPQITNMLDRLDRLAAKDVNTPIPRMPLTPNALAVFRRFRRHAIEQMKVLDGREHEWLAKAPQHVLRLAGTLVLVNWALAHAGGAPARQPPPAPPNVIKAGTIGAAVRLVRDYFWPHARAALRQIGLNQQQLELRRILRWIANSNVGEVGREEIRRQALARSRDADGTQALLVRLQQAGWLRRSEQDTGGRPSVRWQVNPKLWEHWSE